MQPSVFRFSLSALALAACIVATPVRAQRLTAVALPAVPGLDLIAKDLNNRGQIVGQLADPVTGTSQGFIWSESGGLQILPSLGGAAGQAGRINDRGQILGYGSLPGGTALLPFLRDTDGTVRIVPSMDVPVDINASGAVLGMRGPVGVVYSGGYTRVVVSGGDTNLRLHALSDNGLIAGSTLSTAGIYEPFIYDPSSDAAIWPLRSAGTLDYRYTSQISPDGRTLVTTAAREIGSPTHALIWRDGVLTDLTPLLPPGSSAYASGVNDGGLVSGRVGPSSSERAWLWLGGQSLDLHGAAGLSAASSYAGAVNAYGQVVASHASGLYSAATLVTLHPDWTGGNGDWAAAASWSYAGLGPIGMAPGDMHDVVIRPAGSATVRGAALAEVRSLLVGGAVGEIVTLDLNGGSTRTLQGTQLAGQGVLTGSGRLAGPLVVDYGARIEVTAGQRMQLTGGSVDHAGALRVVAGGALEVGSGFTNRALGEVRLTQGSATFAGAFTNEGRIIASGAELGFAGGLDNGAELNVSFGASQVGGRLHNAGSGRIVVSNGAQATFAGDIANEGELRISAGGAANFFGRVGGGGRITGSGQARFEGGLGLAASRAVTLTVDPVSTLGADALTTLGLAGSAGGPHDHLAFTQAVAIEGGTLQLLWLDGASGHAGDRWDLFDWNGGVSGRYATLDLPALAAGLSWDTSALYGSGEVAITSVPEPAHRALWLGGLGLLAAAAMRRTPSHAV